MAFDLAIVIPAYKGAFLARTLASLAAQTDQRFRVYIGDDASPDRIEDIARESGLSAGQLVYHRFEQNLGGESLVRQWSRCIALAKEESWIWLFSDDDLMDPGCVAAFNNLVDEHPGQFDVARFDAFTVDETDRVTDIHSVHSDEESWLEFAYLRLSGQRTSFMQQVIFSRRAYEAGGGFVDLPLAWGSDDAAIITMAEQKTIRRIAGPKTYYRRSSLNISPSSGISSRKRKLAAICLYLRWLNRRLEAERPHLFQDDQRAFSHAMRGYLLANLQMEGGTAALLNFRLLLGTFSTICHGSRMGLYREIVSTSFADLLRLVASSVKRCLPSRGV